MSTRSSTPREAGVVASQIVSTSPSKNIVPLRYLRPAQVVSEFSVSRRTLSNWQRRRILSFSKIGRTVLFRRADVEAALDRFRVSAVGEA